MAADAAKRWEEVRDTLRSWREDNIRQSEEVIELWDTVLRLEIHKLGDEMWQVYEQVCLAAYDCYKLSIADECLAALKEKFKDTSVRVKILEAMQYEVEGRYDSALAIYDKILQSDKTNLAAHKRKIAILKAQAKIPEAIKELTDYMKQFMSDQEAWLELCELYIQEQDYNKAAFCMEELILFHPHNHLYHQRYAEIRYTQGGTENMELARAYFSQAIKINPNNMRALYGLWLSANNIASSQKVTGPKKKENLKYVNWAAQEISKRQPQNHHIKIETMLSTLQIGPSH